MALVIIRGFVLDVALTANSGGENDRGPDQALALILAGDLQLVAATLDMRLPERQVAEHQLQIIRDAQQTGHLLRVQMETDGSDIKAARSGVIRAVAVDYDTDAFQREGTERVDGFVEALSLISFPNATSLFAYARLTTAPPFTGDGGTVGLNIFSPETVHLLIPKNSLSYELLEAALRDNLRVRVNMLVPRQPDDGDDPPPVEAADDVARTFDMAAFVRARSAAAAGDVAPRFGLAITVELLAHLASASRPVWVCIRRDTLDVGPADEQCAPAELPNSDLTPQTMRDLRIPYPAVWHGIGCFNPGVYRFQICLTTDYQVVVDGEPLCLHDAEEEGYKFAHACLGGEHDVRIEVPAWICDYDLIMDVYQLR